MSQTAETARTRISDRSPSITGDEIAASLVPPRQFTDASFASYRPDPEFTSQQEAVELLEAFSTGWTPAKSSGFFGRKKKEPEVKPGVYLDGGFGVGKTHLLAALWHAAPGPRKYFGTFIEYTALVGALGYAKAVEALTGSTLLCIDEFELDDPGDTMMMTRLLTDLVGKGTRVAATSNTPPNALGEGRFAAQDFLREIHAMSSNFTTLRIDGNDFRRRSTEGHAATVDPADYSQTLASADAAGERMSDDTFDDLIAHLATVHPSKYIKLIDGLDRIGLRDVHELHSQTEALRLVAFIDRVYDAQIPITATGVPLDQVFAGDMLSGGYRKKYLRSMSRMIALTETS
ncbi:cell division protein ZapE [Mycetocola manganoxydans]|uniref:Cell division protein ZapE n=1 Tax=Mycetocola manganoxydans TaxID=699879 RepID=A0A3L6ZXS9_9MICO|nr:cell division protein ZapE [Mycetocola manganoxydans]RLP72570.1 cell division protein ZapE [Mycetocola manganoxydans]GHD39715.1 cell division protein ZapE [Mycetocola manganoxydans]